ncbi:hypothetical protein MHO82_10585 [Vibrio sp. Of7-15]|uniref:hypothetical protein n=1 Tax=Vibrio sp. Of7-15 TaxID=2724879 RepID=UPI001EF21CCC|nr:hypothetical protein [Vibrio sp. Of7-15]MCG7497314.1 hypothetical protein [Vibrio sp. Of7-15]
MRNINIILIVILMYSGTLYAKSSFEFKCEIDYSQSVVTEQAEYIRNKSYDSQYDFRELGVIVASKDHFEYPERFLIINEGLVREYKINIIDNEFLFKSNDKVLIHTELSEKNKKSTLSYEVIANDSTWMLVNFSFYNPETMKNKLNFKINVGKGEITKDLVGRTLFFNDISGLECNNSIQKTTFKDYKMQWFSLMDYIDEYK